MSTSFLYHAFGLRGYRYVNTMYLEGHTVFRVEPKPEELRCSACGSRDVVHRGSVYRTFRTVPIGGKGVLIGLEVPRLGCACGAVRQAEVSFAEPRRRHTKAFARYALELSRYTTIQDAARHLGGRWDTIKEILAAK
jgi:transposase